MSSNNINNNNDTTVDDSSKRSLLDDITIKEKEERNQESLNLARERAAQGKPPIPPVADKSFLMPLLTSIMISQLMFLNIASFMPTELKNSHPTISVEMFGIILSMYNVARLFFSIPIGSSINKVGKKNYIIIGFICLIASTAGFSILTWIQSNYIYVGLALLFRFLQGIGGTILQVVCFAIILKEYGAKKEVGLAYLSAARGLGFLGGPLTGQIFYN